MVSTATQIFVREMFDLQIDYNIKIIIFACLIFYAFFLYYIKRNLETDTFPKMIFSLFSTIYIYITVIFLPLFTIMLFSSYSAIKLWTLILQLYGGVFVIMALSIIFFGWNKVLEIVGINIDTKNIYREKKRKGEE